MNILSSTNAMSKMDPVLLAEINMKMQKLLEVCKLLKKCSFAIGINDQDESA